MGAQLEEAQPVLRIAGSKDPAYVRTTTIAGSKDPAYVRTARRHSLRSATNGSTPIARRAGT
jgi:hypothetical protein